MNKPAVIGAGVILGGLTAFGFWKLVLKPAVGGAMAIKDRADFVRRLWVAFDGFPGIGPQQKAILIGQGALETGWGMVGTAPAGHNFWNMTAGRAWLAAGKPVIAGRDTDGHGNPITQSWRAYPSDHAGAEGLLQFLRPGGDNGSKYAAAWSALLAGDVLGYVAQLRAAGYFTAPLEGYQASVSTLTNNVLTAARALNLLHEVPTGGTAVPAKS